MVLPGGKYFQFYNIDSVVGKPVVGAIARYFPDGTVDTAFRFSRDYHFVGAAAALPNGQVIVAARRGAYGAVYTDEILRLNQDGSIDPSFSTTLVAADAAGYVAGLMVLESGKILVSGFFTAFGDEARPGLVRLLADGGVDPTFAAVPLSYPGFPGYLASNHHLAVQPDGKIIIFGTFDQIGASSFPLGVARLNSDGTVDSSFQPSGFTGGLGRVRCAVIQADGKIIIGGFSLRVPATFASNPTGIEADLPLVRLHMNGTADESYGYFGDPRGSFSIADVILQPDGKALAADQGEAATIRQFNLNGTLDEKFHQPRFKYGKDLGYPYHIERRSDGRLMVSGGFTDVDTTAPKRWNLGVVRLNASGAVDRTLKTKDRTGLTTYPTSLARAASGATYVAFGDFATDTVVPNNFARLRPDGTVDSTFNPFKNAAPNAPLKGDFVASEFVRLGEGKLFISGRKGPFGEFVYGRLLPDGMQDLSFDIDPAVPTLFSPRALAQPDNAVLLGSEYAQDIVNGDALIRLAPGGALDNSFELPAAITSRLVARPPGADIETATVRQGRALAVQPDGKILFVYFHSNTTCRLVRLNANGSLDGSFSPSKIVPLHVFAGFTPVIFDPQTGTQGQATGIFGEALTSVHVQSNGGIVIAGPFKTINGKPSRGIARLNANGAIDSSFKPGKGPRWTSISETPWHRPIVEQVESQADGRLLITGTFEAFNGVAAPGIASLNPNGSTDSSFVPPAIRQKEYFGRSVLERQPDGSFLLSGLYSYPGETLAPLLIHILAGP